MHMNIMAYLNRQTVRLLCWLLLLSPILINQTVATENTPNNKSSGLCHYERDIGLQSHFMLFVICNEPHYKK